MPILAGGQGPSQLSINPGSVQVQGGIPSIGDSAPIDKAASRVSNVMQDGPTVVVPRGGGN